jgi:hypothetical protein
MVLSVIGILLVAGAVFVPHLEADSVIIGYFQGTVHL